LAPARSALSRLVQMSELTGKSATTWKMRWEGTS
jgi:hypothetical protein